MNYKCTGFALIKGNDANIISYTLSQYDDNGNLIKSNIRKSCVVKETDTDVTNAISVIDKFISDIENT